MTDLQIDLEFQHGKTLGFSEKNQQDISQILPLFINFLFSNNTFENIKYLKIVFIGEDIYEEYVKRYNNGHSPSSGALAICLPNNHIAIKATQDYLNTIYYSEKDICFPYSNIITHELAHIDLKNRFELIDTNLNKVESLYLLDKRMTLREVLRSFEEYYACSFSEINFSEPILHNDYKEYILKQLSYVEEKKFELQKNYNGDYGKYFEESFLLLVNLFTISGYYLGSQPITNSDALIETEVLNFNTLNDLFVQIKKDILSKNNNLQIFDDLVDFFDNTLCDFFDLSFNRELNEVFVYGME